MAPSRVLHYSLFVSAQCEKREFHLDMTASSENVKFLQLRSGERVNINSFCNVVHTDDGKLPTDQKSGSMFDSYREHFKTAEISVPTVDYKVVDSLLTTNDDKKRPEEFVKFVEKTKSDYDRMIEYDCDEEDYLWIKNVNKSRKKNKEKLITPELLEKVMDKLEKESCFEVSPKQRGVYVVSYVSSVKCCYLQVKGSPSMVPGSSMDGDDVCCVCGDGDVNNVNQIIYCDMCNIAVHQDCYGVPYIPEGQWLCRRCKLSPSTQVECCLCPNTSGAFKQTSDGRWAHVICAIWLNEVLASLLFTFCLLLAHFLFLCSTNANDLCFCALHCPPKVRVVRYC
ncbi:unnamed protein product [Cylicostephanus goldi]|uniref:PHD-type domain-containing protein n=1 Tax=Cylicostephanus goldi TaxID=71465 RepID=A0A3P6QM43_CYLGO|nr:unnamed protein product [Cylicostephanus goldi]